MLSAPTPGLPAVEDAGVSAILQKMEGVLASVQTLTTRLDNFEASQVGKQQPVMSDPPPPSRTQHTGFPTGAGFMDDFRVTQTRPGSERSCKVTQITQPRQSQLAVNTEQLRQQLEYDAFSSSFRDTQQPRQGPVVSRKAVAVAVIREPQQSTLQEQ